MTTSLVRAVVGIAGFLILDGMWLGLLMTRFYRDQLGPMARLAGDTFAPNWPAAAIVYLLLGSGVALFVAPRAADAASAARWGALFGFVVYGVYDFNNYSTLRQWPLALALVDTAWGTMASAACAVVVRAVAR